MHETDPSPNRGLASRSFIGLLVTQFFGAMNDNMFRWFVVPVAYFLPVGGEAIMDKETALTLGLVCFTIPYLLFATFAGYLADRYSKRTVIVACKVAEIGLMVLGASAILSGQIVFLFVVVALMGTQSALFGPAKFGSIPEIVSSTKISSANGLLGLVTVVASAAGVFLGLWLFSITTPDLRNIGGLNDIWQPTAAIVGVAIVGFVASLMIRPLAAADPSRPLHRNPITETWRNLRLLGSNKALLRTAFGISFFWFLASLANVNITSYGIDLLQLTELQIGVLLVILVLGVGVGSILAGFWSGGKVELGLVPLGATGIAISSLLLFVAGNSVGTTGSATEFTLSTTQATTVLAADDDFYNGKWITWTSGTLSGKMGKITDYDGTTKTLTFDAMSQAPTAGDKFYISLREKGALPATIDDAYWWTCLWLFFLGATAGLFNIPLEAFLQHRSEAKSRGIIIAASNFITFSFILFSAVLFYVLQVIIGLSADKIFLVVGLGTIPVVIYTFWLLPQATIRFIVWLLSHTVYKIRIYGNENIPEKGGALIVANHVSWLDGALLLMISERPIRMLAYSDYISGFGVGWLCRTFDVIPINASDGPKALVQSLNTAKEAVKNGELVCIFAEGQITRDGQLQPFQRGMMRIVSGTGAPVIPTYLDELWGSIFSYQGGKLLWKWPRRWPYTVSILFGKPLTDPDNVNQIRQAVETLGVEAVEKRSDRNLIPAREFLRACRAARSRAKVADSSGAELTGGKYLAGSIAFRRLLQRSVLAADEKMVGILLPPSVGGALANTSLALLGRVAVNLNYTLSDDVVNHCIKECGIKHILTSKRFLAKKPMELNAEFVYLEDLKEQITGMDKFVAALQAFAVPIGLLERMFGLTKLTPDDLMTVIFTSGSTGEPKGVMLSQQNIGSNIESAKLMFHIKDSDVFLGVLPFFHSFGYTIMLWLPSTTGAKSVYHFNPLDARTVGKLCEKHEVSILSATPTFLKGYLKRCSAEQMKTLDLAIVGAEKLPLSLGEAFHEKFGVWPAEGFGTTEMSPLGAANVPAHRAVGEGQVGSKPGTVGRAAPNVVAKIVNPDTGEDVGTNTAGLMLMKGPNVMVGYLNQPEKTAEVIKDGWYNTGDIAKIDDEGFIEITGRQSRFSKIGGEMVPHIGVENELARIVEDGEDDDEGELKIAVTCVTDEKKGERLIVLHTKLNKSIDDILKELAEVGFPNIWMPTSNSFLEIDSIPILGTGKLDLKGIKDKADEAFGTGG